MTAAGFNAMGGRGVISVAANIAPALCAELQNASLKGDFAAALALQDKLAPLIDALFRDTNPGPAKYAMLLLGLMSDELRLPLAAPPEPVRQKLREALENLGLTG